MAAMTEKRLVTRARVALWNVARRPMVRMNGEEESMEGDEGKYSVVVSAAEISRMRVLEVVWSSV